MSAKETHVDSAPGSVENDEKSSDRELEATKSNTSQSPTSLSDRDTRQKIPPATAEAVTQRNGLLFDTDGKLVLQPAPTQDPRDPLNMPGYRKFLCLFFMNTFGAMSAATELILGAMLPVFSFEYANPRLDPALLKPLTENGVDNHGRSGLDALEHLGGPPIWHIYLLASAPLLMMGISNLFLIPLAISIGRRPVFFTCGILAVLAQIWAGKSQSLYSHIAARCFQAIGAGTVESLVPFIIQDMAFNHQRNSYISGVFAAQGAIIIGMGIAAPYLIIYISWRYVYFYTAIAGAVLLLGVFFFMPETRWDRTKAEMAGIPRIETQTTFPPRNWVKELSFFQVKFEWRKGWNALYNSLVTFFYPHIFFITLLNSAMIATAFGAGYTMSSALIARPWSWPFLHLGFCLFPVLISGVAVAMVTGFGADQVANWAAKKHGKREPEHQLINLVLPTLCAIAGSALYAVVIPNPYQYSFYMGLFAFGLMTFGFLGANTVGAVYVLECYPHLAGPSLVNIASFRMLIAFVFSFKVSEWIVTVGYFNSFMIYTGLMAGFALLLPVVWIYGAAWRKRWPADHLNTD